MVSGRHLQYKFNTIKIKDIKYYICDCEAAVRPSQIHNHLRSRAHYLKLGLDFYNSDNYVECECGIKVLKKNIDEHLKKSKHVKYMNLKENSGGKSGGNLKKNNPLVDCVCGSRIQKYSMYQHVLNKKHIETMKAKELSKNIEDKPIVNYEDLKVKPNNISKYIKPEASVNSPENLQDLSKQSITININNPEEYDKINKIFQDLNISK